jgi:hypothetical protein
VSIELLAGRRFVHQRYATFIAGHKLTITSHPIPTVYCQNLDARVQSVQSRRNGLNDSRPEDDDSANAALITGERTYSRSTILMASEIFALCSLWGTLGPAAVGDAGLPGSGATGALAAMDLASASRSAASSLTCSKCQHHSVWFMRPMKLTVSNRCDKL